MALRLLFRRVTPPALSLTTSRVYNTHSGPKPKGVKKKLNLVRNVYLKQGTEKTFHVSKAGQDSIRVRIDIPGVSPELLKIRAENNRIHFSGSEDPEKMHEIQRHRKDIIPRTYSGVFNLDPNRFRAQDHVSHLVNGVLYLLFKCSNPNPVVCRYHAFALELSGRENSDENEAIYNPFVSKGDNRCYTFDCRDVFVLAVDVPGVSSGEHTLTVEGSKISFRAEADLNDLHPFEMEVEPESIRVYQGSFEMELEAFEAENAKAVVEFGMLWIEVPRRFRQPTTPGSSNLFSGGRICFHFGRFALEFCA